METFKTESWPSSGLQSQWVDVVRSSQTDGVHLSKN